MRSAPRKQRESGFFREVWKAYNDLVDYCREIAVTSGRGVTVTRTANGTLLSASVAAASDVQIKQFRVKSVQNDYLVCREFDGTTELETDVNVAKPFELRRTGWHGVTVTYTLESILGAQASVSYAYQTATYRIANGTEHQGIRPFYVPDQTVIFASKVENGTGVEDADEWIDINTAGRAWAAIQ